MYLFASLFIILLLSCKDEESNSFSKKGNLHYNGKNKLGQLLVESLEKNPEQITDQSENLCFFAFQA